MTLFDIQRIRAQYMMNIADPIATQELCRTVQELCTELLMMRQPKPTLLSEYVSMLSNLLVIKATSTK